MMQWNGKRDVVGLILVFFLPAIIGMIVAVLVPLAMHPILFWFLMSGLFVVGFVVVWKRTRKKP